MKENHSIAHIRGMKMTPEEKSQVWDGVLRRASDYPPGEYPFSDLPNNWDGVLRRKADFPEGTGPHNVRYKLRSRLHGGGWMISLGEAEVSLYTRRILLVVLSIICLLVIAVLVQRFR